MAEKIPYEREFKFHPKRRWKFDFMITPNIAVECEGGVYAFKCKTCGGRGVVGNKYTGPIHCRSCNGVGRAQGGHNRGKHFEEDVVKYNEAAILGYKVIRVTANMIKSGEAIQFLKRAIGR